MAEAWLCSQEPLVRSAELGCTVDEVESLIKRHEAFQKSAVAWEERFTALEKLTAVRTPCCVSACERQCSSTPGAQGSVSLGAVVVPLRLPYLF